MGVLQRAREVLDELHISESEMREALVESRTISILKEHRFHEVNNDWSYTDTYEVPPGFIWEIIDVVSCQNLTGVGTGFGNALEVDIGFGMRALGALNLSSAAGGAPNRGSTGRYTSTLLPLRLTQGNRIRVLVAPDGLAGKYTIITYREIQA